MRAAVRNIVLGGYTAEARALFARMTTQPGRSRKRAIDTLIRALKNADILLKLDALYIMAATDAQAAGLNWIATNGLTAVNSPTFTADRGYTGDGATSHLDTGIAFSALTKYLLNDNLLFSYELTNISSSTSYSIGSSLTSGRGRLNPRSTTTTVARTGTTSSLVATLPVATSIGLVAAQRTGAALEEAFKNGASCGTGTSSSTSIASGNVLLLLDNAAFSARQLAVGGVGASLSAGQHASLYSAVLAYLQAAGAA